jgi:hypothetical protein
MSALIAVSRQSFLANEIIVYPGSQILIFIHPRSLISKPGSNNCKKREGEKNVVLPFYSHKYHKIEIILLLKSKEILFWTIYEEL